MAAVILDTDIGTDIDDSWALAMLLRSPEADVRLIATGTGDPAYRAGIVAGLLTEEGRDDVPIAIGLPTRLPPRVPIRPLSRYAGLDRYRGRVVDDGVRAIVDCIMGSIEPVTIVTIGPVTNIAAALELEPAIAENARVVGMLGSIRSTGLVRQTVSPTPEYNVAHDVEACRAVLEAGWDVTIAPLDTCGMVALRGGHYASIRHAPNPLLRAVMRDYREWHAAWTVDWSDVLEVIDMAINGGDQAGTPLHERSSTLLSDTVAVYLAYDESFVEIDRLPIAIDDSGAMRISPGALMVRAATSWRDLDGFTDHLAQRLLHGTVGARP